MTDDRVKAIRERLETGHLLFNEEGRYLLAELERARKVVEFATRAVDRRENQGFGTKADFELAAAVREYDAKEE